MGWDKVFRGKERMEEEEEEEEKALRISPLLLLPLYGQSFDKAICYLPVVASEEKRYLGIYEFCTQRKALFFPEKKGQKEAFSFFPSFFATYGMWRVSGKGRSIFCPR